MQTRRLLAAGAAVSLVLTLGLSSAANAAQGVPGPPDGGEDTTPNSLSVPALFVGTTGAPFTCTSTAAVMPTGTTLTYPTDFDNPLVTPPEGGTLPAAGEYYIQGVNTWQAECGNASDNTLTVDADWGDNLGGDAKTSVGSPIRVEMGLLVDPVANPETAAMQGFNVVKLTEELDRYATYGTMGTLADLGEVRAYDDGARLMIVYKSTGGVVYDQLAGAELNATGRVVYGYNWSPTTAGVYTLVFTAPSVSVNGAADGHTVSIDVTVDPQASKGGKKGGSSKSTVVRQDIYKGHKGAAKKAR